MKVTQESEIEMAEEAADLVEKRMAHIPRRDGTNAATHCAKVAARLADARCAPPLILAGLLHDILEDTQTTEAYIRSRFGNDITDLVVALTKDPRKSGKKQERDHLRRIETAGPRAVIIKLVDNALNLETWQFLKHPERYLRYASKIQAMGIRALGEDHSIVIHHLRAMRSVSLSLTT